MNKKKILVAVGGTGGHVFPGYNLAKHLSESNYDVELVTDRRGYKFLDGLKDLNINILPSSSLNKNNLIAKTFSLFLILYSIVRSLKFLLFKRPSIIFGMGGYASFPICIAAKILRIKYIIYENNLIIGRANKMLSAGSNCILVSQRKLEGISEKYRNKVFEIGNIINKEILSFSNQVMEKKDNKKLNILVLGGSQAAQVFAEQLPEIFFNCSKKGITIKIFQHCLASQNEKLNSFYKRTQIEFEIFNFSNNLIEYFSKADLAITRSGSSMLAELSNANIPFISIPLPSSADKHQQKNAKFYQDRDSTFVIDEQDLSYKLLPLIQKIYNNSSLLKKIKESQVQYSDKNVYNNVNQILKKIIDEKN